jgi:hypothetical protein
VVQVVARALELPQSDARLLQPLLVARVLSQARMRLVHVRHGCRVVVVAVVVVVVALVVVADLRRQRGREVQHVFVDRAREAAQGRCEGRGLAALSATSVADMRPSC